MKKLKEAKKVFTSDYFDNSLAKAIAKYYLRPIDTYNEINENNPLCVANKRFEYKQN
jgi:hypothetical protein